MQRKIDIKKNHMEILQLKNTAAKIKNLGGSKSIMEMTEERAGELKDQKKLSHSNTEKIYF